MCCLNISIKDNYVNLGIKKRLIKYLVTPSLVKYTSVKKFDRSSGVLILKAHFRLLNGKDIEADDQIDLKSELGFAFKSPEKIINEIEKIHLLN